MPLPLGKIIAQNAYVSTAASTVAMCYAGQSQTAVQLYVSTQHSAIQAQLIASGLVTISVIGVTAGTETLPAVGVIS